MSVYSGDLTIYFIFYRILELSVSAGVQNVQFSQTKDI